MTTMSNHPASWNSKPAGRNFGTLDGDHSEAINYSRLVRGRGWRRHDGVRWQYKKFVEYGQDRE